MPPQALLDPQAAAMMAAGQAPPLQVGGKPKATRGPHHGRPQASGPLGVPWLIILLVGGYVVATHSGLAEFRKGFLGRL